MKREKAVIIGAGALGLGFLAERMASDYDLCLADTQVRSEALRHIEKDQGFSVNVCSRDGIAVRNVTGSFEVSITDEPEGREKLCRALQEADLILTATNRRVLDKLVSDIAPIINTGMKNARLLFCENGLNIARSYASCFGSRATLADTIMSRMCRFADSTENGFHPLWHGGGESLVVEDYHYLPLDADQCSPGQFSPVFSIVSHARFLCLEDIKLYLHNGMHAFVAYHAYLEGVSFFPDTPTRIRKMARQGVLEEVVPAIVQTHNVASQREEIERYGLELLERFFNPYFNDSIERGIRGIEEKLSPGERLVGGCEYIRRAGIEPKVYASTIDAGLKIRSMMKPI